MVGIFMEGLHTVGGILQKDKYHFYVHLHDVYLYMFYIYEFSMYMLYV
jgi:hypothetical protein